MRYGWIFAYLWILGLMLIFAMFDAIKEGIKLP